MRIGAYIEGVLTEDPAEDRCQLFRLLSEKVRLRLLALASVEELSVGELAELLGESQPNVSRHAAPLRKAGLLAERRDATRLFVRLATDVQADPVVADAIVTGRRLCAEDGSLERVGGVVRARDAHTREFFARPGRNDTSDALAVELPAYLAALSVLIEPRDLAVDAGTGDGVLLDLLAPLFRRVVAIDRSEAQLGRALARVRARAYDNVTLVADEVDGAQARRAVGAGADVVVSARMLHHAPLPRDTMRALAALTRDGGYVIVVDYEKHDDDRLSHHQADVWMGFTSAELIELAQSAGLEDVRTFRLPTQHVGATVDAHVGWQALVARRPLPTPGAPEARPTHLEPRRKRRV